MSVYEGSVLIDRPVKEVWQFISDPQKALVWGRGVSEVLVTSQGPLGAGSTLRLGMGGQKMEARIIEFEPDKKFTLEFTAGPVRGSQVSYAMEWAGGKTKLTRDLVLRLAGFWKLMLPVLHYREVRDRETGVANIKCILEAQTQE